MRILAISKYYPPLKTARAYQIEKVLAAIQSEGVTLSLIAGIPEQLVGNYNHSLYPENSEQYKIFYIPYVDFESSTNKYCKFYGRIQREFISQLFSSSWSKKVEEKALEYIKSFEPDIVFSSSTPPDSHFSAYRIKKKFGIRWIASFSDPYPLNLLPPPYFRSYPLISALQRNTVKTIMENADGIHMPNKYAFDLFPELNQNKKNYMAIPHINFNAETEIKVSDNNGWVVHAGKLTKERVSYQLLEAVRDVVKLYPRKFNGLLCIGDVCPEFKQLVAHMQLHECVRFIEKVPQNELGEKLALSVALIVIEADMPQSYFLPSKFADYSSMSKPIIALSPRKSAIRDYLCEYGGGIAVIHDTVQIRDALIKIVNADNQSYYSSSLANIFKPETVGRQYVNWFHEMLKS